LGALAQVDGLELIGLADLFEQHVDAYRAGAGRIIELHRGFLVWLKGRDGRGRFTTWEAIGED
jgi:hypothetical protein